MSDLVPIDGDKASENGLTPVYPASIHWPPTADGGDTLRPTEKDMVDIENLIETLAKIALSVARREKASG